MGDSNSNKTLRMKITSKLKRMLTMNLASLFSLKTVFSLCAEFAKTNENTV